MTALAIADKLIYHRLCQSNRPNNCNVCTHKKFALSRCCRLTTKKSCVYCYIPEEILSAVDNSVSTEALVDQKTTAVSTLNASTVPCPIKNPQQELVLYRQFTT